jgi:hypothetical protein
MLSLAFAVLDTDTGRVERAGIVRLSTRQRIKQMKLKRGNGKFLLKVPDREENQT